MIGLWATVPVASRRRLSQDSACLTRTRLVASVQSSSTNVSRFTCPETRKDLGTVIREPSGSAVPGTAGARYRLSAGEGVFEQPRDGRFFLAAAMVIVHSDHGWLA